jgi:hypothetical protein
MTIARRARRSPLHPKSSLAFDPAQAITGKLGASRNCSAIEQFSETSKWATEPKIVE